MSIIGAIIILGCVTLLTFLIVWGMALLGGKSPKSHCRRINHWESDEEYIKNGGKIVFHHWGKERE